MSTDNTLTLAREPTMQESWHVDSNGDVLDERSLLIARPQHKRHAHKLAAAPDLYAALKAFIEVTMDCGFQFVTKDGVNVADAARAAISKADNLD